jgi:hypothetical protein
VDAAGVREALGELRGAELLQGARGTEPADLDAVAETVARVSALAESLGDGLESLEINPLLVRGSRVEALDALITWRSEEATRSGGPGRSPIPGSRSPRGPALGGSRPAPP